MMWRRRQFCGYNMHIVTSTHAKIVLILHSSLEQRLECCLYVSGLTADAAHDAVHAE
jgi:hypothetical protein